MSNKNKKIYVIAAFITAILLLMCFIQPILILIYKNTFKNQVVKELQSNCEYYEKVYFEGEFNNYVHIDMNLKLKSLDYTELKKIIQKINQIIANKYEQYKKKITYLDNNISNTKNELRIFIHIENDIYECSNNVISKNGITYTEDIYLKEKIVEIINNSDIKQKDSLIKNLDNILNISDLKDILLVQDSVELNNKITYVSATNLYDEDNIDEALNSFKQVSSDYKNTKELIKELELLKALQGTWYGTTKVKSTLVDSYNYDISHKWIIKGKFCYNIYDDETATNITKKYQLVYENNVFCIKDFSDSSILLYKLKYADNSISYKIDDGMHTGTMKLNKQSDNTILPKTTYIKNPTIGMTKSEVENSTWGKPKKINKTTTSYGIHEQWVYYGNKYLYFDNGILTSIQEY